MADAFTCLDEMLVASVLLVASAAASAGPATESYKDQFCTDPRTMKKYEPYVEWADEYSCTRHRCQPGGRNLAIYTVGCKRVEAPESAIECEEVVEDTNMQFPFCCTRLRCLVVVRGEVWTRVLGQPWEHLPAAPWSHMYKMKKPPPGATPFLPKTPEQGPVYELMDPEANSPRDKVLRSGMKTTTENPDCNDVVPRAAPAPDIVIALSTNSDKKDHKKGERKRHKRLHKSTASPNSMPEEEQELQEVEDAVSFTEKSLDGASEERVNVNAYGVTQRTLFKSQHHQVSWTEIPPNQWSDNEATPEVETNKENNFSQEFPPPDPEKLEEKPNNLQALVDAIGTRMRDIENVVQRMSEKVHRDNVPEPEFGSLEKRSEIDPHKHQKDKKDLEYEKIKKPSPEGDHYKRFSVRNRGSKYLHSAIDSTTEQPLFIEDTNMNGYFSDASNNVLRRANRPKEPAATYMAPVDTRKKASPHIPIPLPGEEKKRKKHVHKKKRGKGHGHKKHHAKEDKRKHFTKLSSVEIDKNAVSLEDSGAVGNK